MPKKEFTDVDYEMFTMPFGKYQGKTFDEIPASYLLWLSGEEGCPEIILAYVDLYEDDLIARIEHEDGVTLRRKYVY